MTRVKKLLSGAFGTYLLIGFLFISSLVVCLLVLPGLAELRSVLGPWWLSYPIATTWSLLVLFALCVLLWPAILIFMGAFMLRGVMI